MQDDLPLRALAAVMALLSLPSLSPLSASSFPPLPPPARPFPWLGLRGPHAISVPHSALSRYLTTAHGTPP
eukprot:2487669-Rhodomonas_salina.1